MDDREKQMQSILDEILERNVSIEDFQEITEKSLETAEYDRVNALLLEHYNKSSNFDFQEVLKVELKLLVSERMISKINGTKELEENKKQEINEIGLEEGVDEDTLEKASKNLERKEPKEEFDLRAELMKQVYIEEFKKYSTLLYRLKEAQAYNLELTVGDKEGTQLVLYEKYLNNLEISYRGYANSKKINEAELNSNDEIKGLKQKLEYDMGKKEQYIDKNAEKTIIELKELSLKRQEVATKISEISGDKFLTPEEFKKQMDYYQEEYRKLTYQMRDIDPTLEKFNEMIRVEDENKSFAKKELGNTSLTGFKSGYSIKQLEIDKKDRIGKITDTTEEKIENITELESTNQDKVLDELIKKVDLCINQGIYNKAEEYLQSIEDILEIKENDNKEAEGSQKKITNENLEKHIDKDVSGKSIVMINNQKENAKDTTDYKDPFDLRKSECEKNALSENELSNKDKLKERFNKVKGKYNELYPNKDMNEEQVPVKY